MRNSRKKKKRSKSTSHGVGGKEPAEDEKKSNNIGGLVDAFALSSINGISNGDPDGEAQVFRRSCLIDSCEDPSTCSTSSGVSGLDFASSSGSSESNSIRDMMCPKGGFRGGKQKRVVAATGTVSTVLGKEYVSRISPKTKGFSNEIVERDGAEQFLYSMLGDDCDLSMAVVRDVLCQCGYDVEMALDVLLDLSSSSAEQSRTGRYLDDIVDNRDGMRFLSDSLTDRTSECTSFSSEGELQDNIWSMSHNSRSYAKCLANSEDWTPNLRSNGSDLPQKVLESLFSIPKSAEHDKNTMNWRTVVKKMQSLGPGFDVCRSVAEPQKLTYAKGNEYHVFREDAKKHWDSMKTTYQQAAAAYTKGDRHYAAYLSQQGKTQTKLAQKADERASHDIFRARNQGIENVITIDLHGQHVKPAMRILKLHLLFGTFVPSVQRLRVITGCGSHGVGKSKLKQSVINLLKNEGIEWSEENQGTVVIKLGGLREFSFLDAGSDNESD